MCTEDGTRHQNGLSAEHKQMHLHLTCTPAQQTRLVFGVFCMDWGNLSITWLAVSWVKQGWRWHPILSEIPVRALGEFHFTFVLQRQHTGNACICMCMVVCVCVRVYVCVWIRTCMCVCVCVCVFSFTVYDEHSLMCLSSTIQGWKWHCVLYRNQSKRTQHHMSHYEVIAGVWLGISQWGSFAVVSTGVSLHTRARIQMCHTVCVCHVCVRQIHVLACMHACGCVCVCMCAPVTVQTVKESLKSSLPALLSSWSWMKSPSGSMSSM